MHTLNIDWTMGTSTEGQRNGFELILWEQLDDLDFAGYLSLPSHNHNYMQEHASLIDTTSTTLRLNVNKDKTKIMTINSKNNIPITLQGEFLDEEQSLTYIGSTVDTNGGRDSGVTAMNGKARAAIIVFNEIWRNVNTNQTRHFKLKCEDCAYIEMSKAEYK